jgi:hypothetical protein
MRHLRGSRWTVSVSDTSPGPGLGLCYLPCPMPLASRRTLPPLRLTAAILVALFAAVVAGFDGDPTERARRAELQASIGALRLVSLPEGSHAAVRETNLAAVTPATSVCAAAARLASDTPSARAARRERLDASGAARNARLLSSALPPPRA